MGKVITVWGSPGSGKSMFSCILAKALTRDKRKAIIINAEISVPMLPVWLPEQIIQTNASVGQVLSSVEIDTSLVAGHVTVLKSYPFIGVMGYAAGENPLSYPEVKYAMVLQLVNAAARLVDFVILDCSSNMTNVFTPAAIESGDLVIRILTPDLKGVNYLKAHQPLLGDGRFHYDQHMTFAGMARPFHALDEMGHIIGGFLDKNVRISVDKTPIVDPEVGINASIRIVNQQTVSAQKLLDSGSATAEMLHFLTACIRYGVSVCIAGATGSGKTTIMAWLLSQVPDNRRLITIEEGSREFDLVKRDENGNILNSVVHLLTRPSENPSLNINQDFLLERVLRKHPDVIGVGEMRSAAESLSAAESSRTGHTVCTTIHSNSCASTYRRMMTLAKRKYMMGDDVLMQIMVEAYPIIVFTKQLEDRSRKIMEIIEGECCEGERLIYRTLYSYNVLDNTVDADGRPLVVGRHKKVSEMSSSLQKRLLDNGISHKELDEFLEHDKEVLNGCRGFTSYASPSSPLDS